MLTASDIDMHLALGIERDILDKARVSRLSHDEARDYGIRLSDGDLSGVVYPQFHPLTGDRVTARLRRDHPEQDGHGKPKNKYVSAFGDNRHLYFAPNATESLADATVPLVIVEAEKSALAVASASARTGAALLPVATGGCWGGRARSASPPTRRAPASRSRTPSTTGTSSRWTAGWRS